MPSLACPHCQAPLQLRELRHQGLLRADRICPACGGGFTVDAATRRRQVICITFAIISLILTLLWQVRGTGWLLPALFSYLLIGVCIYRWNRLVFLVPYRHHPRRRHG